MKIRKNNYQEILSDDKWRKMATDMSHVGYWKYEIENQSVSWSDQIYRIHGVTKSGYEPKIDSAINFYHHDDRKVVIDALEKAIKQKKPFEFRARIITPKGVEKHVEAKGKCYISNGETVALLGTFNDISHHIKQTKRLEEANERYELATKESSMGLWDWDIKNDTFFWSKTLKDLLGIKSKSFSPTFKEFKNLLHPEDRDKVIKSLYKHLNKNLPYNIDFRLRHTNGKYIWLQARGKAIREDGGKAIRMLGSVEDVTEIKKVKDIQKRNEQQLRAAIDQATVGKALVSEKGEWLRVNNALCKLLGYTEKEILQLCFMDITHPDDLPTSLKMKEEVLAKKYNSYQTEKRYLHKKGHVIHTLLNVSLVRDENDQPLYFISEIQDISKLIKDKKKLAESQERLDVALNATDMGIWDWDIKNDILFTNDKWATMLGYKHSEIKPRFKSWEKLIHPDDKKTLLKNLHNHLDNKTKVYHAEARVKAKSGKWKWVQTSGKVVERDKNGEALRIVGTHINITNKTKTLKILHLIYEIASDITLDAHEKINAVLKATLEYLDLDLAIISKIVDSKYKIRYAYPISSKIKPGKELDLNQTYCLNTFKNSRIFAIHHAKKHPIAKQVCYKKQQLESYIGTRFSVNGRIYGTINFSSKSDRKKFSSEEKTIVQLVSQWIASQINNENHLQALIKSETRLEDTVEKLSESNAELGRFAYIASHDLQEPLRTVISLTELLKNKYRDNLDETANQYLNFMVDAATNMKDLVADLLEYSRVDNQRTLLEENVNTNKAIEYVIQNLKESITNSGATITHSDLPTIKAQSLRFISLMQNLISNSLKYKRPGKNPKISITAKEYKSYWQFCVEDNGIGIDHEYYKLIFEPFKRLQNKKEYSGTGIGLAICKKIVNQFGGKIWVKSNLNKGTKFYFTIPK